MPEGDTLFRTAATLHRWLAGRPVTAATTRVEGFPAARLVGLTVEGVESQGKHLLVRFDSGHVLHCHLRMSGSWHVYRVGQEWRRPEPQARLALTCGDRVAVCFNAPVVELLAPRAEAVHPSLANLGPDVLADTLDLAEVRRRASTRSPDLALGDLLLDQRVVAGIGNIYRCEALFLAGHSPWAPRSSLSDDELDQLVLTASKLMKASVTGLRGPNAETGLRGPNAETGLRGPNAETGLRGPNAETGLGSRNPGESPPAESGAGGAPLTAGRFNPRLLERYVYRRNGRPCRRCGTLIRAKRHGELARTVYWCPTCQA